MAQKVKVSTYIKNVGKSFGYSVREVASEYAPIVASTTKDLKSTVRDMKISMQEIKNNSISNATRDFSKGENFLSNTLDDLKTGKWYNQERKDKAENEMFGFDSFDFDFDDEDWGDFSDSDEVDTSSILEHDEMSTNQIISSMGQVGSEISKSLGYTSAKSAEYIVANNNASTRALYDLNAKGFNQVSSILMNMSGNIAGLVQLGEPLAAHMQNSSVFYTQTTESLSRISEDVNKMSSNLQILVDRTSYMDKKGSVKENKNGFGRFMSGGDFSLSSYMDMVKENVKDQADSVKSIISMMEMMMGKNGKNSSLTEAIVKGTVNKLIPTITKDIAKQFDEALSASLGNGLMRAGKAARNKGFLASILADMFLPKEVVKNGVNPSSYEKGPVSWDGIARQSLTYVIPTYLAQMTALLAGVNDEKDYQYYDFKSGKFTTKRVYQRDKEVRDRARARSVGGEFEDIALKSTGNKQMQKEIEEFFYQAMLNGGNFYDIKKGKTDADWRKKYGNISEETVELLLQVLEANNGKGPNKNRNAASKWETRNNQAIADNARRMQEEELLGYSFENRFDDGTSDFILRSAVGTGRGRGAGERNQSVYRTPFNSSRESVNSGNGWRRNDDGTYTVGPNDVIITAADFGKWLDAFESGDTKTARKIENTKAMKDTKDKASNMAKDIGSKAMNKLGMGKAGSKVTNVMDLLERGRDVIQTPMYAVTMALDSLNRGINNLFWGDGSEEGVIDKLKKKISNVWDKIKDKFDDLFGTKSYRALKDMGLSDQFVDIVRTVDKRGYIRYYGVDANGKKKPVSKKVGETYEEQTRKKSLKEAMSNEWTKIRESFKNQQQAARQKREALSAELAKFKEMSAGLDNGNAATGRQVTKAGFAIVSEGEMIVPSEFNPYYHGATNKASQIANEDRIRRNFFGSFAKGKAPKYNNINGNIYTDNKGGYYEYDPETNKYNKIDIKDGEGRKKVASGYKNAIASSGPVGAISEGAKTLAGGIMDFINGIMGKNDKKAQEQEKKNIFASIKQSFIDAGNEKGALGIGAITGVGVSLLTGAVVGPLAGAAIGAGVGLATKSQAFQDLLFGKGDPESDDYRKGLLGSIGEKLKDKNNQAMLKNMGIGGGAGLIAGTFMGSPILGLITGSTIGYISKSQKAQEFLFGTEDEKTALGKLKDKVKEASPNIAAGALAGLVAGPFGVVGNLLVGSGLGYMTTSKRFKEFMFGDGKKDKGLVGKIHDKIVNPLDEIMHNLKNAFTGITRRLSANIFGFFKKLGKGAKDKVKSASKKDNLLGRFLSGVGNVGEKVIGGTVDFAGGILDRVDTGLKKSNLNTGSSVYNKALGRNETAEERMKTRGIIRNGGVTTEQDANGNTIYYKVNANGKKTLIDEKKYNKILARNEKRGGYHENRKFGKIDEAISGMDEETINNLTNKNNKEDARLKLAEILGKDADKIKNSDLAQFISLLGDEKSGRFSKEDKEKDKETKQNKMLDVVNDNLPKVVETLESIGDSIEDLSDNLSKKSPEEKSNNIVKKDGKYYKKGKNGKLKPASKKQIERYQREEEKEGKEESELDLSDEGEESGAGSSTYNRIIRSLSAGDSGEDPDRKTEFTNNGPIQYVKSSQGEWVVDRSDSETKSTIKKQEEFNKSISGIGKITGILGGIGGALGFLKKGLLGDGEKKPGLLSKLFNGLFGEEGALSGILSLFTGEKGSIKTLVKGIFSKGGASIFKTMLTDIGIGALIYAGFSGKLDSIVSSITGLVGGKGAEDAFASKSKDKTTTYDVTLQDGTTTTASKDKNGNFVDASGNILNVKSVNKANQNNVASFSDKLKENTARGILTNTKTAAGALLSKTSVGKKVTNFVTENADSLGIAVFTQIDDALIKVAGALKKLPVLKNVDLDGMFGALSKKIGDAITSQSAANIAKFASNAVVIARIAFAVVDFTTGYEDTRTTLGIVKEPTIGQRILSGCLRLVKNLIPIIGTLIPDSLVIDVFCNYIAPALGIDVSELKNAREEAQETVDSYNQATGNNLSVAEFTKSVMKDYTWTERIGNAAKGTWEDTKAKAKNFGNSIKENGIVGTFKNMGAEAISTFKESFSANGGGISGIISGIGDTFGNMLPGVLGEITKKNAEIRSLAFKGDLKGLWNIGLDDFSGGGEDIEGTDLKTAVPSIFSKIVGQLPLIMNKLVSTPIALVMKVAGKIKDLLGSLKDKIVEGFVNIKDNTVKLSEYVKQGDVSGLWSNEAEDDEGNPLGGIYKAVNFIQKLTMTPSTIFCMIGRKIKDGFISMKDKVVNGFSTTIDNYNTIYSLAKEGNVSGIWSNEITDDEENPLGGIFNAVNFVQKISMTPTGIFHLIGNKIKEGLHLKDIKADAGTFASALQDLKGAASEGDLDKIWSTDVKFSENNPVKAIFNVGITINKLFSSVVAIINKIVGPIKDLVGGIADTVGNIKDKVVDKVKDTASNLWNSATNFISGAFSGGSSGFVSQYDPKYQKYQISGQQFGAKGCGPAVASMAASALGKNLSVGDAVRASNGYQTNNGVTLDYFQNALGSRGINTEIIAGGSSADMYRKIASGEKVILLGQDATNTSKKNSPFGPNNHYVLATGVDRRGNIIVNDPESKGPRTYSPSILTHAKYGIAGSNSGIKSNRTSRIFRFISGAGNPRNDAITQQVWAYLTTKLGMSEAAAAGIMGNMEQESGCQPDIKQKGGGAYGICQWDGGRRDKLKQFPNYQSLSVQLDYLASELPSQYWKKSGTINDVDGKSYSYKSMSYDDFKKLNDVAEATIKFEAAFERAGKPHLAKRISYAKAYYEMFSGKTYTIDSSVGATTSSGATDSSTSTTTTGSTGSSKSGGILNILSTITSAFSNAFRGSTNEPVTKENSQETQTTGVISNSSSSSALIGTGNPATGDMVNNFPYYNQGEEPWKNETYGTGTIKSSGCGPTSMAMVMKSYGSNVTPSDTAKWSVENGYRIPNQGTSWGFFKGIGDKSGLDVSQFGSSETAKQSLLAGIPVIGSMGPGDFTKRGHYIVFSGISKDGSQVYVNDPASRTRSGKVWDTNNAFSQAKQFWAISKNGKGSINTSAAGSGILSYGDLAMVAGGSSGLLMSSRAGANTPGVATFRDSKTGRLLPVRVSGGESDIVGMTSTMLNNVKTSVSNVVSKAKSGTVSAELVAELLKSITNILNNIADNTAPVAKIYNALAAYISSGGGASMDKVTVKKKPETPVAGGGSNEVDSNIAALAGVLAELAKG